MSQHSDTDDFGSTQITLDPANLENFINDTPKKEESSASKKMFATQNNYEEDVQIDDEDVENENLPEDIQDIEQDDSEDEGIDDYRIGGYHPIHIGEILQDRYVVIQKLGWGHFSTVWLCRDFKYETYVAVKCQKSASNYMEAAFDEVEILQTAARYTKHPDWIASLKEYYRDENRTEFDQDDCHVVQLLNAFIYQGPYGNHFCMVFEIMGVNLLEIIKRYDYKGVPLDLVKRMAKQILIGLDYLHRFCKIIHTDLKPENILLCLSQAEITDIVENGQLSRNKQYEERIRRYQKKYGIKVDSENADTKSSVEATKKEGSSNKKAKTGDENHHHQEEHKHGELKQSEYLSMHGEGSTKEVLKEKSMNGGDSTQAKKDLKLSKDFQLKIVDLGNACWTHHHFSTEIQTRQYRSPEVIVGCNYDTSADIWSAACTIFEMLTGDFLFEPKQGKNYDKDDDHLAQIIELVSYPPKKFALSGVNSKRYFTKRGTLKRIKNFHFWPLKNVLLDKYHLVEEEAKALSQFLLPMLAYYPWKRATAQQCLRNPWIWAPCKDPFKLTPQQIQRKMDMKALLQEPVEFSAAEDIETEVNDASSEFSDQDLDASALSFDEEHDNYGYSNTLNRSFNKTGYIPWGGGIRVEELDQDPNWQFHDVE